MKRCMRISWSVMLALMLGVPGAFAQDFMSRAEMRAAIPGRTVYGVSSGDNVTQWTHRYSEGSSQGSLVGRFGTEDYRGTWRISGDTWCEEWSSGSGMCFRFVRVGPNELRVYRADRSEPSRNNWFIR